MAGHYGYALNSLQQGSTGLIWRESCYQLRANVPPSSRHKIPPWLFCSFLQGNVTDRLHTSIGPSRDSFGAGWVWPPVSNLRRIRRRKKGEPQNLTVCYTLGPNPLFWLLPVRWGMSNNGSAIKAASKPVKQYFNTLGIKIPENYAFSDKEHQGVNSDEKTAGVDEFGVPEETNEAKDAVEKAVLSQQQEA